MAIRGFTEEEVIPFAKLARETPYDVRFIEFMPLDADHAWNRSKVLTGAEIREAISAVYPLEPEPREPSSTSQVYRFADSPGRIGFINPVSEPFCSDCNRVRLTADGRLRTCLFSLNETDLRAAAARGRVRRRDRGDHPRRRVAQGAQAPRGRAGLHPARPQHVRHRRLIRPRGVKTPALQALSSRGPCEKKARYTHKYRGLADRQFGHVTRRQLLDLGVPPRTIALVGRERAG